MSFDDRMAEQIADELAGTHPEVVRLRQQPEYELDPGHKLAADYLHLFLRMLYRACRAEGLDPRATTRLVNRTVYGDPDGPPPSRQTAEQVRRLADMPLVDLNKLRGDSGRRQRTPGDGLGPLRPTDYVAEHVPVRVDIADPELREKALRSLGELTPERQEQWLLEGGEERAAEGPPPGVQRRNRTLSDPFQEVRHTESFGGGWVWSCHCGGRSRRFSTLPTWQRALALAQEHHRKKHPGIEAEYVRVIGPDGEIEHG